MANAQCLIGRVIVVYYVNELGREGHPNMGIAGVFSSLDKASEFGRTVAPEDQPRLRVVEAEVDYVK